MTSDLTLRQVGSAPAAGLTDALTSAAGYALSEMADATRRATLADIRRFTTWRQAVGAIALPATPATVAAYLAALADSGLKVSTISRRAAAIAYAHKLASFEPPINESVKAVMRGVRRKLGTAQKGKAPATAAIVAKLVKRVPDTLASERDKALILIGQHTRAWASARCAGFKHRICHRSVLPVGIRRMRSWARRPRPLRKLSCFSNKSGT